MYRNMDTAEMPGDIYGNQRGYRQSQNRVPQKRAPQTYRSQSDRPVRQRPQSYRSADSIQSASRPRQYYKDQYAARGRGQDTYSPPYENKLSSTPPKKKRNKKLLIINIAATLLIVFSVVAIGAMVLLGMNTFSDLNTGSETNENLIPVEPSLDENVSYILIFGMDEDGEEGRTDIMMVAKLDNKNRVLNILQIPRDTFVGDEVPSGKMNAVFANPQEGEHKVNAMMRKINAAFGLPIDHYICLELESFREIIDSIGGVEMYFDEPVILSRFVQLGEETVGPGQVTLNGEQAEGFIRKRSGVGDGSDLARVEHQRQFYAAFAQKMLGLSLSEMLSLVTQNADNIHTDMNNGLLLSYAQEGKKLDMSNISIFSVPGESGDYNGLSYFSIHKDSYVEIYNTYFADAGQTITEDDLDITELFHNYSESSVDIGGSLEDYQSGGGATDE